MVMTTIFCTYQCKSILGTQSTLFRNFMLSPQMEQFQQIWELTAQLRGIATSVSICDDIYQLQLDTKRTEIPGLKLTGCAKLKLLMTIVSFQKYFKCLL